MPHLVKTLTITSLALVLTACANDNQAKRQITDNDSYLNSPALKELKTSAGIILPEQYSDYRIPTVTTQGQLGKALDIRPPQLAFNLLPGSQVQVTENSAVVTFDDAAINLVAAVDQAITEQGYPIVNQHADSNTNGHSWTTDWITWPRADEATPFSARYQIQAEKQTYSNTLSVQLTELRKGEQVIASSAELTRYTVTLLNKLMEEIEEQLNGPQRAAEAAANEHLDVQKATDDSGLPAMIVRAPYATVWARLPKALEKATIEVVDSTSSTGQIQIKYEGLNQETLSKLSILEPTLSKGKYIIQVGDLGNRTSLQFTTEKGLAINEQDNSLLVSLMEEAFN